jgi:nucleoside-diphosphate-sugar epimerase
MKTLITGHKGFIGKNLSTRFDKFIGIDEEYTQLDLYKILDELELDVIFHIGACSDTMNTDLQFMMKKNYLSTKWIVDWAKLNNVKIIYSSSASVYGSDGNEPSNLYGWTKMISEDYVVSNGGVALRYFNVTTKVHPSSNAIYNDIVLASIDATALDELITSIKAKYNV